MGATMSALTNDEVELISREESLSQAQVKRLYSRFQKLDPQQSGTLDAQVLMMIPELAMNPLHPRLVAIFENNNFREFVSNVSAFNGDADDKRKADFAFKVYDIDNDDYISFDDLYQILVMLVGDNVQEDNLKKLVREVIDDADTDNDGRISRAEFGPALDLSVVKSKLCIQL